MPSSTHEARATPPFRRERRWFSFGLAALTFAVMNGVDAFDSSTPSIDGHHTSIFWIKQLVAFSGAVGTWIGGYLAYTLTLSDLKRRPTNIALQVLKQSVIVPLFAFPISGAVVGLFMAASRPAEAMAGVALGLLSMLLMAVMAPLWFALLVLLCAITTGIWSAICLHVIYPRLAAPRWGESTVAERTTSGGSQSSSSSPHQ